MNISRSPALSSTLTLQKAGNKFRKKRKKVSIFGPLLSTSFFSDFIADKRRPSQLIDPIEEEEEDQEVQEKRRRVNTIVMLNVLSRRSLH